MPQIEQLSDVFASQLFWLIITFALIYFGIGRWMLPRIAATVEARDQQIAGDLTAAERARAEADETEAAYRERIDAGRAEAMRVTQASKQKMAVEAETRIKAADAEIGATTKAAEEDIRQASTKAMAEVEKVAAEIAQELVAKLASVKVSKDRAAQAVKAVFHG